jgi:hypothetical protein
MRNCFFKKPDALRFGSKMAAPGSKTMKLMITSLIRPRRFGAVV